MSSLKELTIKRAGIKGNLTRFKNYFDNIDIASPDFIQLEPRLNKLESSWDSYGDIQTAIELLDEDNLEAHNKEREHFENDFFKYIALAKRLIEDSKTQENGSSHNSERFINNSAQNKVHNIKLPTINLPNFDGCYC